MNMYVGLVLAVSNTTAGLLSDMTRATGYGNVGCFIGGGIASGLAALALLLFSRCEFL
jgi:hypothetical protein